MFLMIKVEQWLCMSSFSEDNDIVYATLGVCYVDCRKMLSMLSFCCYLKYFWRQWYCIYPTLGVFM